MIRSACWGSVWKQWIETDLEIPGLCFCGAGFRPHGSAFDSMDGLTGLEIVLGVEGDFG
jgi:hypothetical protein